MTKMGTIHDLTEDTLIECDSAWTEFRPAGGAHQEAV
jgi:hypothetical protein